LLLPELLHAFFPVLEEFEFPKASTFAFSLCELLELESRCTYTTLTLPELITLESSKDSGVCTPCRTSAHTVLSLLSFYKCSDPLGVLSSSPPDGEYKYLPGYPYSSNLLAEPSGYPITQ
jgi:hypothetical protein